MATRSPKNVPMCVVQIGFTSVLMPAASGIKVVQLLGDALACEDTYSVQSVRYRIEGPLRVQYSAVQTDQVCGPDSTPERSARPKPLAIGHS